MVWTATVAIQLNGDLTKDAAITYSDGTRSIVRRFTLQPGMDQTYIQRRVRDDIDTLTKQDASASAITPGPVIPAGPDQPPAPPVPTQAELDQAAWLKDYAKLCAIARGVAAGAIDGTMPVIVALQAKSKANVKAAYLDFI